MTENSEQPNVQSVDEEPLTRNPAPAEGGDSPQPDAPAADSMPLDAALADLPLPESGSTDEGWVMDSESPDDEPAPASPDAAPDRARGRGRSGQKLTRVTLGSALIAMDTVNERLDRLDEAAIEGTASRRSLDDVLVPMSEWQEQFGVAADRPMRHLMLGMMVDARSKAGATGRFLNRIGNSMAGAINLLLSPVRTQRVFRPVKQGFEKAADRGDSQLERWRAMGRAEDARSRALAETALSSAAEETMDELAANDRIEVFIQEIIEAQTAGIVDEIIEEIRERGVSSDNFFERPVRRVFRRPDRSQIPKPDFDPRLVRPILRRNSPIPEGSLLGHYAGFTSRLLALIIDVSLIVIVLALGSSLLNTAVDVLGLSDWFDSTIGATGLFTGIFAAVNGLTIVVGYLVLFWLLTGQTLGMMLLGVRVVSRTGGRVTFWQTILRIIGYILLPGIFFMGFLWILLDDKREAWHDKLARTYVVYAWDARPDETFLTYTMYMDE